MERSDGFEQEHRAAEEHRKCLIPGVNFLCRWGGGGSFTLRVEHFGDRSVA